MIKKNKVKSITEDGIYVCLDSKDISQDSLDQQNHYDIVYKRYLIDRESITTITYTDYMDKKLLSVLPSQLGHIGEICCGHGEALTLLKGKYMQGFGIDISLKMLNIARERLSSENTMFIHGDALDIPLADNSLDHVVVFGGIHHVPNRKKFFEEIYRILKPGGAFVFREPADDFWLWRLIRKVVYYFSSALDHKTERPLLIKETIPVLENAGFKVEKYQHLGFLGFCFFMNSDVLIFNRIFKFIPGIQKIVQWSSKFDDFIVRLKPFRKAGLQVIGVARKPCAESVES